MLRFLFPCSLFLSAVLLFSIQPMAAKALLPIYGGTPAVWTVCMLFFQLILLIAYGYAGLLSLCKKTSSWRLLHGLLLLLSFTAVPLWFKPTLNEGVPEWSILYNLLSQLGLPLLVIGASAPLLQFAYSQTKAKGSSDPYFLYIASNLGSLASLLLYPVIIERFIGLNEQFYLWNLGYYLYVGILVSLFLFLNYSPLRDKEEERASWHWHELLYWIFLSFIPCSLMLGVTLYITTDVAATPLFWVLPLALYLFTFIIAFTAKPLVSFSWLSRNCIFFLIFTILCFVLNVSQIRAWQIILFNLLSFFVLALLCHRQLFLRRPPPQLLTLFYFCLAVGGVLAGIFNGILAPHWFNQVYEYPLAILLSLLVLPGITEHEKQWPIKSWPMFGAIFFIPIMVLGIMLLAYLIPVRHLPGGLSVFQWCIILALIVIVVWAKNTLSLFLSMLILFLFIFSPWLQPDRVLLQQRNFYGVKKVVDKGGVHVLISQSTVHGLQLLGNGLPDGYSSYYGGLASVVKKLQKQGSSLPATIIGLGIGTMVCQFRAQDQVNVIEIDEQVIDLARNRQFFTYLSNCPPKINIIKNDGRLAVEQLPNHSQLLLAVDAFNSDAIPVHLLTLEAFKLYQKKISAQGVILVNLSNRHLDLLPVLTAAGKSLGMMVFYQMYQGQISLGQFPSEWALLTGNLSLAAQLIKEKQWHFVGGYRQFLWTDDYSNLIPLLKW